MAEMYTNELFQKLLVRAQEYLREEAATALDMYATFAFSDGLPGRLLPPSGSPIEAGFELWWQAVARSMAMDRNPYTFFYELKRQEDVVVSDQRYRLDFRMLPDDEDRHIGLAAQADFGVPLPKIGIELDGHDFHEKTKEQATHRNQRDRDLQRAGWTILHFSGSEFVRHPQRCVEEVFRAAQVPFVEFAAALTRASEQQSHQ